MLDSAIPLAALLPHGPGPYAALMLAGFAIGIVGHLTGSRLLVASGVTLIVLGALLLPLLGNVDVRHGADGSAASLESAAFLSPITRSSIS